VDCKLLRNREPAAFEGSWLTSGTESQIVRLTLDPGPVVIDAATFSGTARDWVVPSGTEVLTRGVSGSELNAA
jgi:hypothetical protein